MFFRKKKSFYTIDLPSVLKGKNGIFAAPVNILSLDELFSGYVLCVQDDPQNIIDLSKIKTINMQVKVGGANTSHGLIIFILFIFSDIRNENDKFTYEVLLNPNDSNSYEHYLMLHQQKEWRVLIIQDNEVLVSYQLRNTYNIGTAIEKAIQTGKQYPCLDFMAAKNEYFRDYNIEDLIKSF